MTHCERVFQVLADGQPHSHLELYALGTVAHSRISDLRRKGYLIEQWREGDLYLYRLDGLLVSADPEPQTTDREAGTGALPQGSAEGSAGTSSPVLFEVAGRMEAPAWG